MSTQSNTMMTFTSPRHGLTPQTFVTVFLLLSGAIVPICCYKVSEGGVASLSCQYSVKRFGLSRVCWGRGCGTLWCSNTLIQTDENGVISKADERYRLTGDILEGQMDLDIADVRRSDSGPYCCRVDIDGLFNDKKVIMNLRVVKGALLKRISSLIYFKQQEDTENMQDPGTALPAALSCFVWFLSLSASINSPTTTSATTTTTTTSTTIQVTEASTTSGVNGNTLPLSPQLDLVKGNSTKLHSTTITAVKPAASLSLHINVPVLSLSLSVLTTLAAIFLCLAFKRGSSGAVLRRGCFSSEEPPHIIYEIRLRRAVQENIYTLD
ncbi:T-cell immunoglobulin and mucin domain-containing protein 4 isoform X2 [Syngnathus acus]|uniref:T-cell immunoglobulin and mucin domain-containing protein 4 isoform X2 n=1 Tax=Syngnathus acus TaxID=161584 RepID=UPI0018861C72|nr:T-cell immunoglobulin and mucin domain-containing protein 4 isoform X2 [Syngnathus acus]